MTITREELAAFADGELDPARHAEVAAAVAADPALADEVRAHRALRDRLTAHFTPILDAPLPDELTSQLRSRDRQVVDFTAARNKLQQRESPQRYRRRWIVGTAVAASLALAVFLPRGSGNGHVDGALADALDQQLIATQSPDLPHRILLSFQDESGTYCRVFSSPERSGIACREPEGWRLRATGAGAKAPEAEYRMAGNAAADVLQKAQDMAAGPGFTAEEERAARARGWR